MSEFTGIFISKDVLQIPNLPFLHKGVLAQIIALSKESGVCWATDGYLSELFGVERNNMNRIIRQLSAAGYVRLKTDIKAGNKREITPCINPIQPLYQNDTTPCIKMTQPLYQNDTTPCINPIQPLYQNDTTLYNDESKEESKVLNQTINHNDSGEKVFLNNFSIPKEEKGETPTKAPPVPGAPPKPETLKAKVAEAAKPKLREHTFAEDELSDTALFLELFSKNYPQLDAQYYYLQISSWIDRKTGKPAKRTIWASVINQFVMNDYKKGTLQLSKQQQHESKQQQFQQLNSDTDEWLERRIARRNAKRGT